MNFLITGAAGFLGSSLANHLAREGHQVRGLDDLSTGDPKVLAPDVHFTRGDVSDRPKLWTLLQDVDVVYHLAARVSVQESILYPRDYNAVNVGGTVALMEAMRDVGVKRVVLASSGAVYGDMQDGGLKESDIPNPRSPYAVSKIAAEHYVRTIGNLWNIETVSLRIFNAYGPGQHLPPSHPPVVPHYLRQALRGGTLVAHGDGSQTRDYIYVDVGSGRETSIKDLIRAVLDVTESKANVVYNAQSSGGVSRMKADLSLAKEKLRFTPSIGLEDGLRLTLQRDSRFK
jgi:UDP-glucose 4-epimerase